MTDQSNPYDASTTGHVWDDNLAELTNPPPKWWMIGFHASWLLVLVYSILYPAWPWIGGATEGVLGWTSIGEYNEAVEEINAVRSKYESQLPGKSAAAILADNELSRYVERSAKVLFGDNCAACHGSGGAGNPNYPVLADDDWLYGGKIDAIKTSIANGRMGMMPAKGGASMTDAEASTLASAIASGKPTSTPLFTEKGCVACHGMDGKGNQMLGAPNLTDGIWRFGNGNVDEVKYTIVNGVNVPGSEKSRNAVMPKFGDRLSDTEIKKLAVYVYQLGGGQ